MKADWINETLITPDFASQNSTHRSYATRREMNQQVSSPFIKELSCKAVGNADETAPSDLQYTSALIATVSESAGSLKKLFLLQNPAPGFLLTVRLVAGMAVVLSIAGLLIMGRQPVAVGLFTPPWDKVAHLVVFAMIGAAAGIASGARGRARISWCVLIAIVVGAIDEIHQHYLPGRAASWSDLLADGLGGLVGGMTLQIAFTTLPGWFRRR